MIDVSFVGWLTLAGAALLVWVAFPALAPRWRICASIAFAAFVAAVMLHPPKTVVAAPEVATRPEPVSIPPAPVAARKAAPKAVEPPAMEPPAMEPALPVVEPVLPAVEPDPPRPADPCIALAGLKKEHCIACGGTRGLTRALCEGAATNRYCNDETGSDPDCPDAAAPDPA